MNIRIKYNKIEDEFTKDLSLQMRIERYIENHFYPIIAIANLVPTYLVGGSIRDLIMAKHPKDLDFVIIGNQNESIVLKLLAKFQIKYELNRLGGYKFEYHGIKVDLWVAEDLFSSMQYNVDGLYYDVNGRFLLSLTFEDFLKNGLRLINPENNIEKGRERKLVKFANDYLKEIGNN